MSDAIQHPATLITVKAAATIGRGHVVSPDGSIASGTGAVAGVAQAAAAQGDAATIAAIGDVLARLDTAAIGTWSAGVTKAVAAGTEFVLGSTAGAVVPISISGTANNTKVGVSLEPLTAISGVIQGFPDACIRLSRAVFS